MKLAMQDTSVRFVTTVTGSGLRPDPVAQPTLRRPLDLRFHGAERIWRIDVDERRIACQRHFGDGFRVARDEMARANIAAERRELREEATRPYHRVAALAAGGRYHDQRALFRIKGGKQLVDERGVDLRHVAKAHDDAVHIGRHRRNAGLERARKAFGEMENYFSSPKNLINQLRNRFAFHYDPRKIQDQIAAIDETDKLEIYATEKQANLFYLVSEVIVGSAMLETVKRGDYKLAIEKLTQEIMSLSLHLMNFADGCLLVMRERYLGTNMDELAAQRVEIPDPPHRDEILLPYFSL